jgi:hypothetical protein
MENIPKIKRLPRYHRVAQPPPVIVGYQEKAILEAVYSYRFLTRNQIVRLLFNPHSATWVDDKLKRLYHNEYLERIFLPTAPGSGSSPAVYCLDRRGRDHMAKSQGISKSDIAWRRTVDTYRELPFLDHTLRVNDFRIALDLACRQSGLTLEWIEERELKKLHHQAAQRGLTAPGHLVVPDGYCRLKVSGRQHCFFLEMDNSTQEKLALRRKIRNHIVFTQGPYQTLYSSNSLTVLMVTSGGEARLEAMRQATRDVSPHSGMDDLFLFATLDSITPDNLLNEAVWRPVDSNEWVGLLAGV